MPQTDSSTTLQSSAGVCAACGAELVAREAPGDAAPVAYCSACSQFGQAVARSAERAEAASPPLSPTADEYDVVAVAEPPMPPDPPVADHPAIPETQAPADPLTPADSQSVAVVDTTAAETAVAGSSVAYQCSVCRGHFPAQQVYESNGAYICRDCWSQTAPPATAATEAPAPAIAPEEPAPPVPARPHAPPRPTLLGRVTCPHCWHRFAPHEILWISRHSDMTGDPVAGDDAPLRFLPSRFTADGAAVDARGLPCQALACPRCRLVVPRPMLEAEPLFVSIVGVASSGKSYFLTAMTWALRQILPTRYGVAFNDADGLLNRTLGSQEELLFLPADPDRLVKLDKTDVVGSLMYDQIRFGQQVVSLPRPFLFIMRPTQRHPSASLAAQLTRVVCLYDNAGEHFSPGEDTVSSPVTQHLGTSRVLMFFYDPTQDPRFRARMRELSDDPQLDASAPTRRQETVLMETAARVRQLAGLAATQQVDRALIVIVPKADVWAPLVNLDLNHEPILPGSIAGAFDGVDLDHVEQVSDIVREMLLDTAPEFVTAAEEFCSNVVYIPTSALGSSPRTAPGMDGLWIRPAQVKPKWVTIPFLYMFGRWSHDVIGGLRRPK